jgi:tetratricopeptide (TPR) repeat protein
MIKILALDMTSQYTPLNRSRQRDQLLNRAYRAHNEGRIAEAESAYRALLHVAPDDVDGNNLLGLLYLQTRRPGEAIPRIERAIAAKSDDAQAHYNLGLARRETGKLEDAARSFAHATEIEPGNPEAYNALGNVLRSLNRSDDAADAYQAALAIDSSHGHARNGLSDTLNDAAVAHNLDGRVDDALAGFHAALDYNPGNAEALINLGILLEQTGDAENAAKVFKKAIAAKPDFIDAHYQLAHLRDHASTPDEIAQMKSLSNSLPKSDKKLALLSYALGKAYEKNGEYASEFRWLEEAHRIMASHVRFDVSRAAQFVARRIEAFPAGEKGLEHGTAANEPMRIFIVGMPRSGTTLTEQILASHPNVTAIGEQTLFGENQDGVPNDALRRYERIGSNAAAIVDSTPTNFLHIGVIATTYPTARFVHCTRDPLDTCCSIYQHPLSDAHSYAHTLRDLGAYYRLYERIMTHWHTLLPGRIHDIAYERTVAEPEASVRALLAHCELPFDETCLRFYETRRTIKTPSASQVRKPLYSSSVGRWRRYEEQLQPLVDALRDQ